MDTVEIPVNHSSAQFSAEAAEKMALELNLTSQQILNVIALLDEGNTVPFITRYRKERTGNLDEVQIRDIQTRSVQASDLGTRFDDPAFNRSTT